MRDFRGEAGEAEGVWFWSNWANGRITINTHAYTFKNYKNTHSLPLLGAHK